MGNQQFIVNYTNSNRMASNRIDPCDAFSITNVINEMFHCMDKGKFQTE